MEEIQNLNGRNSELEWKKSRLEFQNLDIIQTLNIPYTLHY
jgi:hypothetical protein